MYEYVAFKGEDRVVRSVSTQTIKVYKFRGDLSGVVRDDLSLEIIEDLRLLLNTSSDDMSLLMRPASNTNNLEREYCEGS